jgi:hypothetical protein
MRTRFYIHKDTKAVYDEILDRNQPNANGRHCAVVRAEPALCDKLLHWMNDNAEEVGKAIAKDNP